MKFVRTSVELNDSFGYNDVFGRPPILLQVTMTGALDAEDGCRTKKAYFSEYYFPSPSSK